MASEGWFSLRARFQQASCKKIIRWSTNRHHTRPPDRIRVTPVKMIENLLTSGYLRTGPRDVVRTVRLTTAPFSKIMGSCYTVIPYWLTEFSLTEAMVIGKLRQLRSGLAT